VDDEEIAACMAAALGRSPEGIQIEPLGGKQGLLVCRVRVPGAGSYVFKAVRESGRRELALTALLARRAPGTVPPVLAYEEDTRRGFYWLVTQDMGARRLADAPDVEGYVAAAQTLAQVQMAVLDETETFRAMGVPFVGAAEWEEIALKTLEAAQEGNSSLLRGSLSELERVIWATGDVARGTVSLPMALVHGDLHGGNIALLDEDNSGLRIADCRLKHPESRIQNPESPKVCLLDWGSAYVGATLLALEELLWPAARYLRSMEEVHRVRAAYFRTMAPLLGKPGRLERAFAACQTLVRLELLCESLRRNETPDEFAAAAALRKLLDAWRTCERL